MKTCQLHECGRKFEPTSPHQYYCTPACNMRAKSLRVMAARAAKRTATCQLGTCGRPFAAKSESQMYCSQQCTRRASKLKYLARQQAERECPILPTYAQRCRCGEDAIPTPSLDSEPTCLKCGCEVQVAA